MIQQLQRELADLRREVRTQHTAGRDRDGDRDREEHSPRGRTSSDTDESELPARWPHSKEGRVFKAYDKNGDLSVSLEEWLAMTNGNVSDARRELQTRRYNDADPNGDGRFTPAEFIDWYVRGRFANSSERRRRSAREGDGARAGDGARRATRDGEDAERREVRDGEGGRRGPRDGEDAAKTGPRDGDAPAEERPRDGGDSADRGPRDSE